MGKVNILAIGAHPDDIEFGCGGALIKYTQRGHRLFLLVMTGGELGGSSSVRTQEQKASGNILGAEKIYWGGYEDTHLVVDVDLIGKIEAVIAEVKPDFIFCNFPDDTHQDHRHTEFAAGIHRASHSVAGCEVTPHGVNGNFHCSPRGRAQTSGHFDFDDFLALVKTAVGTHAVGLLRLVAVGAHRQTRRGEAVVGPPLVTACL